MRQQIVALAAALAVALFATGCSAANQSISQVQAITVVDAPSNNSAFHAGEHVPVKSNSTNPNGVARVELSVDGTVVQTSSPPQPMVAYSVSQAWTAAEGTHTISVQAFDQANQPDRAVQITVTVLPVALPTAVFTPTVSAAPTIVPALVLTPTRAVTESAKAPDAVCTNAETFVRDVTVPDGAPFGPGQIFTKTWQVRNTGTCTWGAGYTLAFESGDRMGTSSPIVVPSTLPGATANLSVSLTAPKVTGANKGFWQLRGPGGKTFGPGVWVRVNIGSGEPAAAPALGPGGPGLDDPAHAATFGSTILSLKAGKAEWVQFTYDNGGNGLPRPTVTIQLLNGVMNGLGFEVYSPETMVDGWSNNKPVGRGTPEMTQICNADGQAGGNCTTNNLSWTGGFGLNATYFVRIINTSGSTVAPQIIVGGPGLAQCSNPDQSVSPAKDRSTPLFRTQCLSPIAGTSVP